MYKGWVYFCSRLTREEIEKISTECSLTLDIRSPYPYGTFYVEIRDEDLDKLDKYWGQVLWSLEHKKGGKDE